MKSDRAVPVAIVGGGFSGTMVAAHLADRGVDSVLIDGSGRAGRGVAYSTPDAAHLLNVRAEGMSAWPDRPHDFAERFEAEGGEPSGFAERRLFGRYLRDILDQAVASGRVELVEADAAGASREGSGWRVLLDNGTTVQASSLVLATGNQQPEGLRALASLGDRFIVNPWGEVSRAAVEELSSLGGSALLVGTGLTMVDFALSLETRGFGGHLVALSRRGQVPRAHADTVPSPIEAADVPAGALLAMWKWLRRRSSRVGWRAAVDSLRPHTADLWGSLPIAEQRRFLRHARPWWDVHRHRIAPQVADLLKAMIAEGRLEIAAGRVLGATRTDGGVEVSYRKRGASAAQTRHFDYVFNCTGPLHAIERTQDPLLRSLLDSGVARPDALGIGLEVDGQGQVRPGGRLWAVGPLTKGRFWEIIAVPDIREQAAAVAQDIATELGR